MFYYLFEYFEKTYQLTGASLFQYLSFRSALTFILALVISTIFGKKIIEFLKSKQIDENIRELNLPGEKDKKGTPTMGGIIIVLSTLIPIFLFSDFKNIYILILITTTIWLTIFGFLGAPGSIPSIFSLKTSLFDCIPIGKTEKNMIHQIIT